MRDVVEKRILTYGGDDYRINLKKNSWKQD